ncbi:MAG: ABC transporter ATP-binding protein [Myxococcales bacterium]|nr:ABC transporter ATP-binding protein [Myxococcales bacterium]
MAASVTLEGVERRFAGAERPAVAKLSLELRAGQTLCLVGPSGCGKSTTLRMIAGLDEPDSGRIRIGDRDMRGVAPQARDVAMVFQGFALYPHMKARDIIAFPLKMRRVPAAEREKAVSEAAELLDIQHLLDRRPDQLSGGERQRVAMGRAIVRRPEVFLFDEPLSNLDAALRAELRVELGRLLRELGATAVYVTHDQVEAMTLGHQIAVMRAGRLEQLGTPREIYEAPASAFVAGFFGSPPMALCPGESIDGRVTLGDLELVAPLQGKLTLGIRSEIVHLGEPSEGEVGFSAAVVTREPLGAETHLELSLGTLGDKPLLIRAKTRGFDAPEVGAKVRAALVPAGLHWFDGDGGKRLAGNA